MNYRRRVSDREEFLEDAPVTTTFCNERSGDLKRRMESMEETLKGIREENKKNSTQLAVIMGIIVFIGTVAGLAMQYFAIIHGAKP